MTVTIATTAAGPETDSRNSHNNMGTTEPRIAHKPGLARGAQHQENQTCPRGHILSMPTAPIVMVESSYNRGRPRLRHPHNKHHVVPMHPLVKDHSHHQNHPQPPTARPSIHFQHHGKSIGLKSTAALTFGMRTLAPAHGGDPLDQVAHQR